MKKSLPVGVENFKDIVESGYYYIDKSLFIKELLDMRGKVNLFLRPRRFGKTLNLSMLRYFYAQIAVQGLKDHGARRGIYRTYGEIPGH